MCFSKVSFFRICEKKPFVSELYHNFQILIEGFESHQTIQFSNLRGNLQKRMISENSDEGKCGNEPQNLAALHLKANDDVNALFSSTHTADSFMRSVRNFLRQSDEFSEYDRDLFPELEEHDAAEREDT
uniref:Uncharacterized protein n=1 Tax=Cannabis sativa TaxID=3483 RepID=A0A803QSF4_CANSA